MSTMAYHHQEVLTLLFSSLFYLSSTLLPSCLLFFFFFFFSFLLFSCSFSSIKKSSWSISNPTPPLQVYIGTSRGAIFRISTTSRQIVPNSINQNAHTDEISSINHFHRGKKKREGRQKKREVFTDSCF